MVDPNIIRPGTLLLWDNIAVYGEREVVQAQNYPEMLSDGRYLVDVVGEDGTEFFVFEDEIELF